MSIEALEDLPARTRFMEELTTESVQLQMRDEIVSGERFDEQPLLPGGLVPSADGLAWAEPAPHSRGAR
jgi:hypothetical protein